MKNCVLLKEPEPVTHTTGPGFFNIPETVTDKSGKVTIKDTEPARPLLRDYLNTGNGARVYTGPARDTAINKAIDFINGLTGPGKGTL